MDTGNYTLSTCIICTVVVREHYLFAERRRVFQRGVGPCLLRNVNNVGRPFYHSALYVTFCFSSQNDFFGFFVF